MKPSSKIPVLAFVLLCSVVCSVSCKKKPTPPVVTTANVSAVTQTGATSGGNVTSDGGAEVTARGVCWSTSADPTTSGSKTSDGKGTGSFTSTLSQLTPGTPYFVRAYATNEAGTAYGNPVTFTSSSMTLATVITTGVSVTGTTAIVGGNITSDGGGNIIARGICWGATFNPTVSDNVTNEGNGTGTFSSTITGLSSGETYHARAYATNSAGVQYGDDVTFVSTGGAPTATTEYPSTIGSTYVTLNASVDPNYISTVVTFEYGTTTSYGQSATAENSPLTGAGSRNAWVNIPSGLIPATNYHFRVKAVNSSGTVYGEDNTFTTLGGAPTATTEYPSTIGSTYVTLNASVDPNYISTVVTFEYGTTTSYGQSVTAENSPLTGAGSRNAWVNIPSGLIPATNYHFRVKAVNSSGTVYGEDNTFTTLGGAPTATTENASSIGSTYVTLNASVDPNYISTVVTFEYGTTTSYGQSVTAENSPLTGAGSRNAWVNIPSGLIPATNYHFRVKAVNSSGTDYGEDNTFTTLGGAPTATTENPSTIGSTYVTLNASVDPNYISTVVTFEYGTTTSYGQTVTAGNSPLTGAGSRNAWVNITSGLTPATNYHFRVKAVNSSGTVYGDDKTFKTSGGK